MRNPTQVNRYIPYIHFLTYCQLHPVAYALYNLQFTLSRNGFKFYLVLECGDKPADIVFVLDASGSEGIENFKKELNFTAEFMKGFQVGPQHVQFGLVTFSNYGRSEFYFNTYKDLQSILHKLDTIHYSGGSTHTDSGLSNAKFHFYSHHGARPNAQKIAIVLTDGQSYSTSRTIQKANELKGMGVKVISVGIGNGASQTELNGIATDLQHVFNVTDFNALNSIQYEIKTAACAGEYSHVFHVICNVSLSICVASK